MELVKLMKKEDIVIICNGKWIAKLTDAAKDRRDILRVLTGILPRMFRWTRREGSD